jgi:predicted ABC-type ATPase
LATIYILAGPNGSGKTTFYSQAISLKFIPEELPFENLDLIARNLGGYSEENYAHAAEIYRKNTAKHIEASADFMIESNLADSRAYDWISAIKKRGYEIVLFYISTQSLETNFERVKRRVSEGGHFVPESIIESRYFQSHSYLKTKLREFIQVYLIDNSGYQPVIQATILNGAIIEKHPNIYNWASDIISNLERINTKKSNPYF